jgi:ABC-type glycerol-3-phosphate transport system permease component
LASRASSGPRPMASRAETPRYWPGRAAKHVVLLLFAVTALVPVYFMVTNSFKTADEYISNPYGIPGDFTLSTLREAWRGGDLLRWLLNSFVFTSVSVVLSTAIAALAAYPITLMRWRPGPWLLSVLIALMVLPPIVLIVPLFQLIVDLEQLNTYRGVIAVYTGLMLPFSTFLLASFYRTVPRELLEAARLDGAGNLRILMRVVVPLSVPALVTTATVQALWVWNEVLIAIVFLQRDDLRTLMVGITIYRSRYHLDIPLVMAGMLWATIPMVLLYLAGQRFFIRGLTAGATKG